MEMITSIAVSLAITLGIYIVYRRMTGVGTKTHSRIMGRMDRMFGTGRMAPDKKKPAHALAPQEGDRRKRARSGSSPRDVQRRAERLLAFAHPKWSPAVFFSVFFGAAGAAFVGLIMTGAGTMLATAAAGGIAFLPVMYLNRLEHKYLESFSEHLPNALGMIAGTLEIGHTVDAAFVLAAKSCPKPVSTEFAHMLKELKLGYTLVDSLRHLARRVPDPDLRILTTTVAVQQRTGGNLAEILRNIDQTIRERHSIRREAKALSAEGKMSMIVLSSLPFIVSGYQYFQNTDMMRTFFISNAGKMCVAMSIILQLVGVWLFKKLTKFEV